MGIGAEGNVKWVDGLRGMASALVVVKHVGIAFFPYLVWPSASAKEAPIVLQWPFIRVLFQGRIGVAIFCMVTGYVCALKPIKCFLQDNHNAAYAAMTKSAVRRVPRLVLPVAIIIFLSAIATQLGAFETANHCDGYGLIPTSPNRRDTLFEAISAMLHDILRVWTHGSSEYGPELWTMMPILKGAFWVYVFLVTTARVQQRWRMIIALSMAMFRWASNDPFFGMQFFFGVFLADLQNLDAGSFTKLQSWSVGPVRGAMSIFFLVVGLYIASLPDKHHDWQPWSLALHNFLASILPAEPDFPRFSSGIGLDLIAIGLHLSPMARTILSNKFFLWLGRMSFAVYLLHNQLLRSVLCWMVYGFTLPKEGEPLLTFTSAPKLFAVLPIYVGLVYGSAHLWTTHVDAWCARMSEHIVNIVKEEDNEKPTGPALPT